MNTAKTYFSHIRGENRGVVTLATKFYQIEGVWHFDYGMSFCSPKDQFVKKVGREQSEAILLDRPYILLALPGTSNFGDAELIRMAEVAALVDLMSQSVSPSWFRHGFKIDVQRLVERNAHRILRAYAWVSWGMQSIA